MNKLGHLLLFVFLSTVLLIGCDNEEDEIVVDPITIYGNYKEMYYNGELHSKYYYNDEGTYTGYRKLISNWDSLQLTYDNAGRLKFKKQVFYDGTIYETEYMYHDNGTLDYTLLSSGYKTVYSFKNEKLEKKNIYNPEGEEINRKTWDYTDNSYVYKNYNAPDFTNPTLTITSNFYSDYDYNDPKILVDHADYYFQKLIRSYENSSGYNGAYEYEFDSQHRLIKTTEDNNEYTFKY